MNLIFFHNRIYSFGGTNGNNNAIDDIYYTDMIDSPTMEPTEIPNNAPSFMPTVIPTAIPKLIGLKWNKIVIVLCLCIL